MKSFNSIASVIVLTAFLFTNHSVTSAMVLCVGSDGHVEIESAVNGDCAPDSNSHAEESAFGKADAALNHNVEHCGSCVDIPIELVGGDPCHPVLNAHRTVIDKPGVASFYSLECGPQSIAQPPSPFINVESRVNGTISDCLRAVVLRV